MSLLRNLPKICKLFSFAVFTYLFLVFALITYFNAPNSYHQFDKRFVVEKGMTFRQVVEKLHKEQVVKSPTTFLYMSQLIKGLDPKVRYGEYFFEKNTSYYKILKKMLRGYIFFRKITISEGLSSHTVLKKLNNSSGLVGDDIGAIKEGSILPETYFYSFNDSKEKTLKRMKDAMTKAIDELWLSRDKNIPIKTKEQAIILASIVEKETGLASERPKVASVFVNRLKKGMKLQSDPTIIYSFTFGNTDLERPIRLSDIRNNSPYNTYHIYGLPPSPICNPGYESIKAVLNPPETDHLYFVATGKNGGHYFSSNLKQHNFYVKQYREFLKKKQKELLKKAKDSDNAKE